MSAATEQLQDLLELGKRLDLPGDLLAIRLAKSLLKVRGRDGKSTPLIANAAQRAFEARRGRENIVLKARQMGLTTWVAGRFFLKTITARGVLTVQVAQTREAAEGIYRMVERMWRSLPIDLREGVLRRSRANRGQMIFPELDSEFRVLSAAEENAGRGWTIQNLHLSEVSRWTGDAAAVLAGLRAALVPGGELVIESTPCGAYGCFYEEWMRAGETASTTAAPSSAAQEGDSLEDARPSSKEAVAFRPLNSTSPKAGFSPGSSPQRSTEESLKGRDFSPAIKTLKKIGALAPEGMVRHFLPWWLEPRYTAPPIRKEAMREDELALVAREGLTGAQIGFRRSLEHRFGNLRTQEFAEDPATCFRATGMGCFDLAAVERRLAEMQQPQSTTGNGSPPKGSYTARRNGALRVWLPVVLGRGYLVVVDPAGGGTAGDFCAIQVLDLATGIQCAELQERLTVREAARVAASLAREYGHATIVVERNNHGSGVLAELRSAERYDRLWTAPGGEPGWLTTSANKPEVVARLGALLDERLELFRSERLLAEMRTFVAFGGGRTGAANGSHDDLVMAFGIGQMVRAEMLSTGRI